MCCGIFVRKLLDTSTYIPYIIRNPQLLVHLCPFKDYDLEKNISTSYTVPAQMFTRKVLCKASGIKKCYQDLLGYAKKQKAKSYHVPLERAGAAQAKKPAKFGQNGLSVPATIS